MKFLSFVSFVGSSIILGFGCFFNLFLFAVSEISPDFHTYPEHYAYCKQRGYYWYNSFEIVLPFGLERNYSSICAQTVHCVGMGYRVEYVVSCVTHCPDNIGICACVPFAFVIFKLASCSERQVVSCNQATRQIHMVHPAVGYAVADHTEFTTQHVVYKRMVRCGNSPQAVERGHNALHAAIFYRNLERL